MVTLNCFVSSSVPADNSFHRFAYINASKGSIVSISELKSEK